MELLPDLIRGIVSAVFNILILLSLLQPKYDKKPTTLVMLVILALDLGTAVFCYLSGNLTLLAHIDVVLFTVLCFAARPFFKDTFMQWLFSYLTAINVSCIVYVLSFTGSRFLPFPQYANSVLRLLLFGALLFLLRRFVRPIYQQLVTYWHIFFYVAFAISMAFAYYFLATDDVIATLTAEAIPLLLIVTISIAAYVSVFHSFLVISRESALKEERNLLAISAGSMEKRLALMDANERQLNILRHDKRHFNATLFELLRGGNTAEALDLLRQDINSVPPTPTAYCQNPAVNAAVSYYAALAEENGIDCDIHLEIPSSIHAESLGLAMSVSNLLENAIHASENLLINRYIRMTGLYTNGQLLLEIANPYDATLKPKADGLGRKSVSAFAESYGGELLYSFEGGTCIARLIL